MSAIEDVFRSISRCPNVQKCLDGAQTHPCYDIVTSQRVTSYDRFQLPVPWVGEIGSARLLFLSSNPSISEDDAHARGSTGEVTVWESLHLAFGGGQRPYIINGIRTTKTDGSPGHLVRYWCSIRARARELIPAAVPGRDYAITEIVHCKSQGERGVNDAAAECVRLHFENTMSASKAKVVIALGKFARTTILGHSEASNIPTKMFLGGQERNVIFLPHPNQRGERKSIAFHYPKSIDDLRLLLRASF